MVSFGKTTKILLLCDLLRWRGFPAWLYISKLLVETLQIDCPWVLRFDLRGYSATRFLCPLDWVPNRATQQQEISSVFRISQFGHSGIFWSQLQSLAILQSACASAAPVTECCVWYHCSCLTVQKTEALSSEVSCPNPSQQVSDQNRAPGCWRDGR